MARSDFYKNQHAEHTALVNQIVTRLNYDFRNQVMFFKRHVGVFILAQKLNILKTLADIYLLPRIKSGEKGQADIYGMVKTYDGNTIPVEIEVKTGNARQTQHQKLWMKRCVEMGVIYLVARNLDYALENVKDIIEGQYEN